MERRNGFDLGIAESGGKLGGRAPKSFMATIISNPTGRDLHDSYVTQRSFPNQLTQWLVMGAIAPSPI